MLKLQGYKLDQDLLFAELENIPDSFDQYIAFSKKLIPTEKRPDFKYDEPDSYEGIKAAKPAGARDQLPMYISELELKNKTHGGVFGRFIGCMLGKPLEISWELKDIKQYLETTGAW